MVGHYGLDLDLGYEVDLIFGSTVHLCVPALAAESLNGRNSHSLDGHSLERGLHIVELERLDDCCDEFHLCLRSERAAHGALGVVVGRLDVFGHVEALAFAVG